MIPCNIYKNEVVVEDIVSLSLQLNLYLVDDLQEFIFDLLYDRYNLVVGETKYPITLHYNTDYGTPIRLLTDIHRNISMLVMIDIYGLTDTEPLLLEKIYLVKKSIDF